MTTLAAAVEVAAALISKGRTRKEIEEYVGARYPDVSSLVVMRAVDAQQMRARLSASYRKDTSASVLQREAIGGDVGPQGPQGPAGPQGIQGPPGPIASPPRWKFVPKRDAEKLIVEIIATPID